MPSSELYAVIMAGGSGTRFWPLSRHRRPKQLLPLAGGRSLLAATVDRVLPLVGVGRTLVVTGEAVADAVRAELPSLPPENVLVEPVGRDTAACVGWMAWRLAERDPDAVMLVLPADHAIPDADALARALMAAAETARLRGGLVTLGVRPTRPETGYGYLEMGGRVGEAGGLAVHRVSRFVEKPPRERAEAMVEAGTFLWNAGMFAWTVGAIQGAIRSHLPELAAGLDRLRAASAESGEDTALRRYYPSLPGISIDFGVMERAPVVWVLAVDFAWSDVGSWRGMEELSGHGGVRIGDVLSVDSQGAILVSDGPLIAAVGVPDVVVVATPEAVLVVPKEQAQRVKELVESLRAAGRTDVL
jgi:mannose-1-phosphate guanylyltransferase